MITGLKGKDYEDKLKELEMESLENRRNRLDMIQTFKMLNGYDKVESSRWFTTFGADEQRRNTTLTNHPMNLKRVTVSNGKIRNNFFSQRTINRWNSLPNEVKESRNIRKFKMNYDNYIGTTEVHN